ncbi:MAG TPA: arginine N-succinyltransferase [Chromatiales bacterium]|nr:arginine N-succinyltransferase [Chromatiales bacterium]
MNTETTSMGAPPAKGGFRGIHVFWIVLTTILVTIAVTFWFVRSYIYAKDFTPVELSVQERQVLESKLRAIGYDPEPAAAVPVPETDEQWLQPRPYAEEAGARVVTFSERELNALIANNKDLARKMSVDLSQDLVSVRLLVPFDPEFPILGGKTVRVSTGVEAAFRTGKPVVVLKGVSLMGVPIPGAWLGGMKNIDLVQEFGEQQGFWQGFAEGVEDIRVEDGQLRVMLRE